MTEKDTKEIAEMVAWINDARQHLEEYLRKVRSDPERFPYRLLDELPELLSRAENIKRK